eukprot:scaffold23523_cov31-Prasinocladus_malaysianus.AAC.1
MSTPPSSSGVSSGESFSIQRTAAEPPKPTFTPADVTISMKSNSAITLVFSETDENPHGSLARPCVTASPSLAAAAYASHANPGGIPDDLE